LEQYRSQKGVSKAIGRLVSRHKRNDSTITPENADLVRLLRGLESRTLDSVNVFVIQTPGRTIFLTEELVRSLSAQKELQLRCDTNSR